MASHNNWDLMYVAGNPGIFKTVRSDSGNPMKRSAALDCANKLSDKNWRVWVQHSQTG
jgi:hypothetical protein